MDIKFNEPIMETNHLFYNLELWHEETGQKIKYKGPYDICCGSFLGNQSKNNLEINCKLQDSNCPIINLNKTYHINIERPLYSILNGTHEATLRIYKYQQLEHDPQRREMIEHLCLDIPFKLLLPSSNLNNNENGNENNENENNGNDKNDKNDKNNMEWKLSDETNSIIALENKDEL
ncbi:predicted protein [Naegleria gruberi]|uniref:Predicted protein n=1 Tax=Naegleria gruberi TaxID=5762 RepID=D2VL71_NAEGR|nr:uncharacterized protein NAEGRDRAFT_69685 [Naegleria gruberi]EFC42566.1 predicted protein [Naegleria gruberi]|eukprot:XP_002675310.1 predicted protein [Naegleria gruberi strain NEG-M]